MLSLFVDNSSSRIEIEEFLTHLHNEKLPISDPLGIHDSTFIRKDKKCFDNKQLIEDGNLLTGMPIEQSPN